MLHNYFLHLRRHRLPVTTTEYLMMLDCVRHGLASYSLEEFYSLSRGCLVKNEALYERFDRAFMSYFAGVESRPDMAELLPERPIRAAANSYLSPEDWAALPGGDLEEALRRARLRLQEEASEERQRLEQNQELQPGIGGQGESDEAGERGEGHGMSFQRRRMLMQDFVGLDDTLELGTHHFKVALRRLRRFANEGAPTEFDLDGTIHATARNAGLLDIRMKPDRYNAMKVLLLFDVSASMGRHVRLCERLFSSARHVFKHLEYFYFYNCIYETLQRNANKVPNRVDTVDLLRKYGPDHKLIIVGDATMNAGEIMYSRGLEESGEVWIGRLVEHFRSVAWLNPSRESDWGRERSIELIRNLVSDRMYPLTVDGLGLAMKAMSRIR